MSLFATPPASQQGWGGVWDTGSMGGRERDTGSMGGRELDSQVGRFLAQFLSSLTSKLGLWF